MDLEEKFAMAEKVSQEHLKKLDKISLDIKRLEAFLQKSGFGCFRKTYETNIPEDRSIFLIWNGARLCGAAAETPLIETKVRNRLISHPFLADFLESICLHHTEVNK